MASTIEASRPLLRFYQTAARVVGWVLLCVGLGHVMGRIVPLIDESKALV